MIYGEFQLTTEDYKMLMIICLITICYMFYTSSKKANRSILLWVSFGIIFWFVFGFLFLTVTEKYILTTYTMSDALSMRWEKLLLEGLSAAVILLLAYLVQNEFISKRKKISN